MQLQDGTLNLPQQNAEECFLLELRKEADFYGLVGLVNRICDYPFGVRFRESDGRNVLTPETIQNSSALHFLFTVEVYSAAHRDFSRYQSDILVLC